MPKIHNLADIFCLPSVATKGWEEQFGYALVEAMACGKPVVSTLTGSIPEVVKDGVTGILVNANDPHALQKALEELILNEKKRKNLGKNARQWVLQEFEANKIARQLAEIYRNFT
jgi:glycosyltransferase involved in cell wall biosynthesis